MSQLNLKPIVGKVLSHKPENKNEVQVYKFLDESFQYLELRRWKYSGSHVKPAQQIASTRIVEWSLNTLVKIIKIINTGKDCSRYVLKNNFSQRPLVART